MIAMVMCAGEGTRLRPLTYVLPKPVVPVANKPVLQYTLENLKKHGINEVVINLSYRPEFIQSYFNHGEKLGMKIHYSVEKKLMGTAGGVKKAESFFRSDPDPDFLVTSGDGLSDINFTDLIQFHRKKKAMGTIALRKVNTRFEYGVTLTDSKMRITKFVEKPCWGDVFSDQVNTGIYVFKKEIFDFIPPNRFYDFGNQVWPELLKKRKPIYGFIFNQFWTDIGNVTEYHHAQRAVLNKEVSVSLNARQIKPGVWIGSGTKLSPGVKLEAPCMIGSNCIIGKNATIGTCTVIDNDSKIGAHSVIKNSILWSHVEIADKVHLNNCTIGMNVKISKSAPYLEGIVLNRSLEFRV